MSDQPVAQASAQGSQEDSATSSKRRSHRRNWNKSKKQDAAQKSNMQPTTSEGVSSPRNGEQPTQQKRNRRRKPTSERLANQPEPVQPETRRESGPLPPAPSTSNRLPNSNPDGPSRQSNSNRGTRRGRGRGGPTQQHRENGLRPDARDFGSSSHFPHSSDARLEPAYSNSSRNSGHNRTFTSSNNYPQHQNQNHSVRGRGPRRGRGGSFHQNNSTSLNPYAQPFVPSFASISPMDMRMDRTYDNRSAPYRQNDYKNTRSLPARQPTNRNPQFSRPKRVRNDFEDKDKPLRERLMNQLEDNNYECMICCQVVLSRHGIWSCGKCYHMFHITGGCIINWAKKSRGEDLENQNKWRCPACQTKYETVPYNYYCFCGKERNPVTHIGETPHSCGGVCGRARGPGCVHPCSEPCHPGPCPECPVMLTKRCSCGEVVKAVRCGTDVKVKCDKVCGRMLSCGEHSCKEVCHDGPCRPCDVQIEQECFCGGAKREVTCSQDSLRSKGFSCGAPCQGKYQCGKHACEMSCHERDANCGPCPSSPDRITRCPCGKSTLRELGVNRDSCEDPIPCCENTCDKVLGCGSTDTRHRCLAKCHVGPCPPCKFNTSVVCRCKQTKRTMPCSEFVQISDGGEIFCEKRCKKRKSCGVHRCQEMCCTLEEHFCMQICNKRLSCGLHTCENICHSGQCPRCLNASFDEQFCHCGRTMRPPPIPCGAPLPECDEPCARVHACNHPVNHRCHGEAHCPPCTYLVERECYGKHEVRKNIPCHIEAVSCGRICGLPLPCGAHTCNRNCHSGECVKADDKCTRPCPILRIPCEHPCALPCHSTDPCPESPCRQMVEVMCDCGRRKAQMKCAEVEKHRARARALAIADSEESADSKKDEQMVPGILKRSPSMEKLACIPCTDECKKVARNKRLADALSIVTNEDGEPDEPTITFTETMKAEFKLSLPFVFEIEKVFNSLLQALADATNCSNCVSHHLRAMPLDRRRFVHEYATFFHMDTCSVDEAPRRSVIVTARRGHSRPPLVLLSDLQKYPGILKAPGPTTLRSTLNEDLKKAAAAKELEEGMKTLKMERKVYKRVAPKMVPKPAPLPQANPFACLGSDVEEEEDETTEKQVDNPKENVVVERDVDWWSDEEPPVNETARDAGEEESEIALSVQECVSDLITVLEVGE